MVASCVPLLDGLELETVRLGYTEVASISDQQSVWTCVRPYQLYPCSIGLTTDHVVIMSM